MNIYNFLKNKLEKYAIHNMYLYLAMIFVVGFFIFYINPMFYYEYFSLDIKALLSGQLWRILTFILYPPAIDRSILLSILIIYVYYSLSKSLLYVWNDFKFNFFFFGGMLWLILFGVIMYIITKTYIILTPTYLILSIFIAFAITFPDTIFLVFFIIPIKAKYLAIFEIVIYILSFRYANFSDKISIFSSFFNLVMFIYLTDRIQFIIFKNSIKKFIDNLKNELKK